MKNFSLKILLLIILISCKQQVTVEGAIARVDNQYLTNKDFVKQLPQNLSKNDSILFRNNFINAWATEQLLLDKAKINLDAHNENIDKLVEDYRKELIIDKYKQAVLQQDLDTVITTQDIDNYYNQNKDIYKLNEDLIQLVYVHFNKDINDKKEVIKLFKSKSAEDKNKLINKELEFNSFNFNDSIWISYKNVEKKLPFLKEEKKIKKDQFIKKEDSIGVYLVAVKNMLYRNNLAPKSYVIPLIKQMILHKRKLELTKKIEQTLINDAIKKNQFEQY